MLQDLGWPDWTPCPENKRKYSDGPIVTGMLGMLWLFQAMYNACCPLLGPLLVACFNLGQELEQLLSEVSGKMQEVISCETIRARGSPTPFFRKAVCHASYVMGGNSIGGCCGIAWSTNEFIGSQKSEGRSRCLSHRLTHSSAKLSKRESISPTWLVWEINEPFGSRSAGSTQTVSWQVIIGFMRPLGPKIGPGWKSQILFRINEDVSSSAWITSAEMDLSRTCTGCTAGLAKSLNTLLGFWARLFLALVLSSLASTFSKARTSRVKVRMIPPICGRVGNWYGNCSGESWYFGWTWLHHSRNPLWNPGAVWTARHSRSAWTICLGVQCCCLRRSLVRDSSLRSWVNHLWCWRLCPWYVGWKEPCLDGLWWFNRFGV